MHAKGIYCCIVLCCVVLCCVVLCCVVLCCVVLCCVVLCCVVLLHKYVSLYSYWLHKYVSLYSYVKSLASLFVGDKFSLTHTRALSAEECERAHFDKTYTCKGPDGYQQFAYVNPTHAIGLLEVAG
jgi:hypothetical protein